MTDVTEYELSERDFRILDMLFRHHRETASPDPKFAMQVRDLRERFGSAHTVKIFYE